MDLLLSFVQSQTGIVVTVVFLLLGVVLSGQRLLWFKWFNEVTQFAFLRAEEKGLLDGIKGIEKLRYYMEIWEHEYRKKYMTEPPEEALKKAVNKATELSVKEKVIAYADPKL